MSQAAIASYHWHLAASVQLRCIYFVLFVASLLLLAAAAWLWPWLWLLLPILLFSAYRAYTHHALWGQPIELWHNEKGLFVRAAQQDGSVEALPLVLYQCRWLGGGVLTATAILAENKMARQHFWLCLMPDNSSAAMRRELAARYHAGVLS